MADYTDLRVTVDVLTLDAGREAVMADAPARSRARAGPYRPVTVDGARHGRCSALLPVLCPQAFALLQQRGPGPCRPAVDS
ncbi:hypothetical protein V6C53_14085, partial [Desulfocurvibacter africanus]|uniref:hypothetical protein n=1 Tax=Desulfocurvibacter africanus TaxID=873 RepID=UPI002FDA7BB6